MKIYIVIPAYNEEKRLGVVLEDILKIKLPVIVVDDGSSDKTYELAKRYKVLTIHHKINLGKGAALKTGCEVAFKLGAEVVILMDSDGQHKISDLTKFIEKINTGKYDIVFGSRNFSMGVPFVRFMGNKIASVLINIFFGIYVSDIICGYRSLTKKAFKKINWQSSGYEVETEMVVRVNKLNLRYCEVDVETVYYDKFKGVTVLDALSIFLNVCKWRILG